MRFELAGSLIRPAPVVLTFNANATFIPADYVEQGYTHFDVICIGGGGGMGGGINTGDTGTKIRSFGGAGGGGGFHRARGLLAALPATCPIVVGQGGALGNEHASDPAQTTNGGNGGASSFNTNTCRASGGEGGKRVQSNSASVTTQAHGGAGGAGNRVTVGGGAAGGVAGTPAKPPNPNIPGTPGADGTFINNIGKGGGGGAGGVGEYGASLPDNDATAGGRGSYNPADTSVYGPGEPSGPGEVSGIQNVKPGGASGAKASPLNGLPTLYGRSWGGPWTGRWPGDPGVVVIRLTVE